MDDLTTLQARHRKELKDLQARITNKKKNATKKTRKGVNDECAQLERELKERHGAELASLSGASTEPLGDERPEVSEPEPSQIDSLTSSLETTSLQKPSSQPVPESQPQKKRNRQKERLARRAAEISAASAAAQDEASHMTDHRARESTFMKSEFEKRKLSEKDIEPDGHCLFSAVADQLEVNDIPLKPGMKPAIKPYKVVRGVAAEWIEAHGDEFAGFLEEPLGEYVSKIRDTAEWGGQLELSALAQAYKVTIRVVKEGGIEVIGEGEKELWLAYYRHGYGLGEHYNSLRKV
ncbi:hypothetical protein OQA88_2093 [Cercophora sp. LCS_1]